MHGGGNEEVTIAVAENMKEALGEDFDLNEELTNSQINNIFEGLKSDPRLREFDFSLLQAKALELAKMSGGAKSMGYNPRFNKTTQKAKFFKPRSIKTFKAPKGTKNIKTTLNSTSLTAPSYIFPNIPKDETIWINPENFKKENNTNVSISPIMNINYNRRPTYFTDQKPIVVQPVETDVLNSMNLSNLKMPNKGELNAFQDKLLKLFNGEQNQTIKKQTTRRSYKGVSVRAPRFNKINVILLFIFILKSVDATSTDLSFLPEGVIRDGVIGNPFRTNLQSLYQSLPLSQRNAWLHAYSGQSGENKTKGSSKPEGSSAVVEGNSKARNSGKAGNKGKARNSGGDAAAGNKGKAGNKGGAAAAGFGAAVAAAFAAFKQNTSGYTVSYFKEQIQNFVANYLWEQIKYAVNWLLRYIDADTLWRVATAIFDSMRVQNLKPLQQIVALAKERNEKLTKIILETYEKSMGVSMESDKSIAAFNALGGFFGSIYALANGAVNNFKDGYWQNAVVSADKINAESLTSCLLFIGGLCIILVGKGAATYGLWKGFLKVWSKTFVRLWNWLFSFSLFKGKGMKKTDRYKFKIVTIKGNLNYIASRINDLKEKHKSSAEISSKLITYDETNNKYQTKILELPNTITNNSDYDSNKKLFDEIDNQFLDVNKYIQSLELSKLT